MLSGKGGFTLAEVMVTLIITIIIIAVSSALVISGTNIFARSAQRDMQMNIAETVLSFVSDQLLYAKDIQSGSVNTSPGIYPEGNAAIVHIKAPSAGGAIGSDKGQLFFRRAGDTQAPINIFGANFYQNYDIGMKLDITPATGGAGAYFTLTVTVYNSTGSAVQTRTATKPLLNYTGSALSLGGNENYIAIFHM